VSRPRAAACVLLTTVVLAALLPAVPANATTPAVSGAGTFAYTEQEPPIAIGTGITVINGNFYDGEYLEFVPNDAGGTEQLTLQTDGSADTTAGVVSIVGTFAPNRRLARAQTAAILVRVAEHLEGSELPAGERGRFSDIGRSVHRDAIRKAAAAGFAHGRRAGTFRSGAKETRGQGATFVIRMLDRLVNRRVLDLPL
jgi:hypothetical protein